jgi:CubicO group peptidase (beta-lactamase class C family)
MGARRIAILQGAKTFALAFMLFSSSTGIASQNRPQAADARMARVLSGLRPPIAIKGQPPVRWKLTEEMAEGHVPGMSIAVIDNGQIAWARGFGIKQAGTIDPVTTATCFRRGRSAKQSPPRPLSS